MASFFFAGHCSSFLLFATHSTVKLNTVIVSVDDTIFYDIDLFSNGKIRIWGDYNIAK
jgi:hypothetical protein